MRLRLKHFALFFGAIAIVGFSLILAKSQEPWKAKVPFSTFYAQGSAGEIKEINLSGSRLYFKLKNTSNPRAIPHQKEAVVIVTQPSSINDTIIEWVKSGKIDTFRIDEPFNPLIIITTIIITIVGITGGLIFAFTHNKFARPGSKSAFGKLKPRRHSIIDLSITFEDIAGCEEAKADLQEIVLFLKSPERFHKVGGVIPKGVLLMGPPGTGKTLLAKAVAGEAGVQFFSLSGSDFVEMYVGVGASRVRDLFDQAKQNAPCIIFVDEIDAVGRRRGAGPGGGENSEREQTLNQLLVEMDGFEGQKGIILLAATNRADVLDPALLRPGRFDRRIIVDLPDALGRSQILRVHTEGKIPLAPDVDINVLGKCTAGFSGADLKNLCNEAALQAVKSDKNAVDMEAFESAKEKVFLGSERRTLVLSEEAKRTIAFHEAGHAIVAMAIPDVDPVYKVSIIPRGKAMGVTWQLPHDRVAATRQSQEGEMAMLLGGRSAEEIFLQVISTGAANDLDRVTRIARRMVCEYGMSEKVGPLVFSHGESSMFPSHQFGHRSECSEATSQLLDEEIKAFVLRSHERARSILKENAGAVQALAKALLERETLDAEEVAQLIRENAVTSGENPVNQLASRIPALAASAT